MDSADNFDCPNTDIFDQISIRQTNRKVYSGSKISLSVISELENIVMDEDVNIHLYPNGSEQFELLESCIISGNLQQMRDKLFKDELKLWMRYNSRHDRQTKDGLSYSVFGAPDLPRFVSKSIMNICLNTAVQNRCDRKKIKSSSHFALFTLSENDITHWIVSGRILQRFLLKATGYGVACAFMNQPCEIAWLSDRLRQDLGIFGYPVVLLRIGYAPSVSYSLRRPIEKFIVE
ncbi:hypothetical protein [Coprobacter sp.]